MALPTVVSQVFRELLTLAVWVVWRYETRAGDRTKVPYNPRSRARARVSDPKTWGTFAEACSAYEGGAYEGVGLVLDNSGIGVVDIDQCLDESGQVSREALRIVQGLDSYTEVSPSGRGLHVWVRAVPPGGRTRCGNVEIYSAKRYMTVTGEHYSGTPTQIEHRQSALEAVYAENVATVPAVCGRSTDILDNCGFPGTDEELLDQARGARNRQKFVGLFDQGDTAPYGGDDSAADLALVGLLAFWCGQDQERIDRLFRESALMRPKWLESRGDGTYGSLTITKALEGRTEFYGGVSGKGGADNGEGQSLLSLLSADSLFHTPEGELYATVGAESLRIKSARFQQFLTRQYYNRHYRPPSTQTLKNVINTYGARAAFDSPEAPVALRIAAAEDGALFLDLCDAERHVVRITGEGWQVTEKPGPVRFQRPANALALPLPVRGGSVEELQGILNLGSRDNLVLVTGFLLGSLNPRGPFPVLSLTGEQGSAKSTLARYLRLIVDPSNPILRALPKSEHDLVIAAENSWLLAFDNISVIKDWLSDALCRLSTGGGFGTRGLYTDREEVYFSAQRPVLLNGITSFIERADLIDRCVVLRLEPIPDTQRRTEAELVAAFNAMRPRVLGALLDAVSAGIRNYPTTLLERQPRMADFARWVTATEEALPWPPGTFLAAFDAARAVAIDENLDGDTVASAVSDFIRMSGSYEGTARELLATLERLVPDTLVRSRYWPKSPAGLSSRLCRLATFLRARGIDIQRNREAGTGRRLITLRKVVD